MRNLKRVLSLSLASIMLLGMMVIGSSAASDYIDVDYDNDNVEAIEVLNAIGVMNGDLDASGNLAGTFRPTDEVKRSEMARIMAFLMDLDYDYYSGANVFTDMNGHWASNFAAACYANGIISGRTATTYDPDAAVTAVEAASMLMRALGYFQNPAVDLPDGFVISTIKQAGKIDLFKRVDAKTNEPMTRNDVAQLILNALQSGMVEPATNNKIDVVVGDAQVSIGSSNYVYVVGRDTKVSTAINKTTATQGNSSTGLEGPILDLGEKLYNGELRLIDNDLDVFYRPARTWEFKGQDVGTYVKDELLVQTWTTKVTGRMLYDLLTKSTIDTYTPVIAVDGVIEKEHLDKGRVGTGSLTYNYYFNEKNLIRSNTEAVGGTADNGVITEVYVDNLNHIYYIAMINTYLAKASGDYNEKQEKAKFTVWGLKDADTSGEVVLVKDGTTNITLDVSMDDFDVSGIEDGDICLVQVADGEIQVMIEPKVLDESKISSFKLNSWIVADGDKYNYNNAIRYDDDVLDAYDDFNMKDTSYRVFLDPNNYVLGVEILEDANNYVFLAGMDSNGSNIANKAGTANVIFTDGTAATIDVNMEKSENAVGNTFTAGDNGAKGTGIGPLMNTWCTYSVDNNGVYTLIEVANTYATFTNHDGSEKWNRIDDHDKLGQGWTAGDNASGVKIDKKNIDLKGIDDDPRSNYETVYGNDESVYIVAETTLLTIGKVVINDVDTVVTGVQNANIIVWDDDAVKANATNNKYDSIATGGAPRSTNYAEGAYTLFSEKGYVIASVVVGVDDGVSKHYAFVHSSEVKQEDWTISNSTRGEDGIYTWYRDVILDGEEATLIEKTDGNPKIATSEYSGKMEQGNWYEVKFKADGTVRGVAALFSDFKDYEGAHIGAQDWYINSLADVKEAVKGDRETVVLYSTLIESKSITYEGATLHIDTQYGDAQKDSEGKYAYAFPVASNAKVVLLTAKQIDNRSVSKYSYTSPFIGSKGLEQAINQLNANKGENEYFYGYISAVFESGIAKVVIIHDLTPTKIVTGTTGSSSNTKDNTVTKDTKGNFIYTIPVNSKNPYPSTKDIRDKVIEFMAKRGETWTWGAGDSIKVAPDGEKYKGYDYVIMYDGAEYLVKINNEYKDLQVEVVLGGTAAEDLATIPEGNLLNKNTAPTVKIGGTTVDEGESEIVSPTSDLYITVTGLAKGTVAEIGLGNPLEKALGLPKSIFTNSADSKGNAVATLSSAYLEEGQEIEITSVKIATSYAVTVDDKGCDGLVKIERSTEYAAETQEVTLTIKATPAPKAGEQISVTLSCEEATLSKTDVLLTAKTTSDTVTFDMPAEAVEIIAAAKKEAAKDVEVESVKITAEGSTKIAVSGTVELSAEVKPDTAADKKVTWEVTDGKDYVEELKENATKDGVIVTGKAVGKATIKATSVGNSKAYDTIEVEVVAALNPITKIELKATETVTKGSTVTLVPTVTAQDTTKDHTDKLVWKSDKEDIATVDQEGVVSGVAVGTATITVSVEGNDKITASCTVTVTEEELPAGDILAKNTTHSAAATEKDDVWEIYSYKKKITVAQAQQAIKDAFNAIEANKDAGQVAKDVKIEGTTVTITLEDGSTLTCKVPIEVKAGSVEVPKPLYRVYLYGAPVKINEGEETETLYWDASAVTSLTLKAEKITLVSEKKPVVNSQAVNNDAITADSWGKRTLTQAMAPVMADDNNDIKLVEAVSVDVKATALAFVDLKYNPEEDDEVALTAAVWYVKKDAKLIAINKTITKNTSKVLVADDKTFTFAAAVGTDLAAGAQKETITIGTPAEGDTFVIQEQDAADVFIVKVNGEDAKVIGSDPLSATSTIELPSKYVLINANNKVELDATKDGTGGNEYATFAVGEEYPGDSTRWFLDLSKLASSLIGQESGGGTKIELFTAFAVETPAATGNTNIKWLAGDYSSSFTGWAGITAGKTGLIKATADSNGKFKATIDVQLQDEGTATLITKRTASGGTDKVNIDDMTLLSPATLPAVTKNAGAVTAITADSNKHVYRCVITGDVAAGDFVAGTQISYATGGIDENGKVVKAIKTGGAAKTGSIEFKFHITGVTDGNVKLDFLKNGNIELTGPAATAKITPVSGQTNVGEFTVTFNVTTADTANFGKLVVTYDENLDQQVSTMFTITNEA